MLNFEFRTTERLPMKGADRMHVPHLCSPFHRLPYKPTKSEKETTLPRTLTGEFLTIDVLRKNTLLQMAEKRFMLS